MWVWGYEGFGVLFLRNRAGVIAGSRCEEDVWVLKKLSACTSLSWRGQRGPRVAAFPSAGCLLCALRARPAAGLGSSARSAHGPVLLHPPGGCYCTHWASQTSNDSLFRKLKTTDLRNSAQWLTAWINMIRIGDRAPSGAGQWCLGRDHRRRG